MTTKPKKIVFFHLLYKQYIIRITEQKENKLTKVRSGSNINRKLVKAAVVSSKTLIWTTFTQLASEKGRIEFISGYDFQDETCLKVFHGSQFD